jgi:polyvinyl alcohol dehydrogenase (cytochrome)
VDSHGDIWVSTGNGSVYSDQHAYDNSDSVLELSPSLQLMQFFAPNTWATNNSEDLDMSIAPALLPDGQVVLAGKSRIVYLLNGADLGGIGHQQATLGTNGHTVGTACSDDIDGGVAVVGMTVYLPCLAGIIAVQATSSPAALHLLWSSGTGAGPPIAAAGLIWTIGQNGTLYGLNPATGQIRQQVTIGAPANHFPTPSVGDGLLLAASAEHVVAFAAPAPGARPAPATASPGQGASGQAQTAPAHTPRYLAAIVFVAAAVLIALGWLVARRLRRAR